MGKMQKVGNKDAKSWLGGKRGVGVPGYGVPGYGVPGCGKHGVWWKPRGLSAKHSGTIISPNN